MFRHFRRAGPVRHAGLVVAFARHVEHDPDLRPDPAAFAAMPAGLHAELRPYPGPLPERGPLVDVDAALSLLGRPEDLVTARDAPVARWPGASTRRVRDLHRTRTSPSS